ncbi:MAG: hypothetical protein RBR20_13300 [Desulfobacterales bacterium]|jgi:hypothetical protein|nr:hypothetical protein [Desulfobacteraceae bacterium]MDD3993208.1 hypothetical protein [Desulfobacteraceae bacterium]MDY0313085.1 hypothetical protein [Desulfobacterales bacterium]
MNAPKAPRNQGENPSTEKVIDLTDPIPSPFEDDAPIIELTDRVGLSEDKAMAHPPDRDTGGGPDALSLDLDDERIPIDLLDDAIVLDDETETTGRPDDFVDSLGLEIDAPETFSEGDTDIGETETQSGPEVEALLTSLSPEKFEAILERVIEKIYAEKIEGILVETVERVVNREIQEIKSLLMEDEGE